VKKGDTVLFVENSRESGVLEGQFGAEFYRVAGTELGLYAIFYMGVSLRPPINVETDLNHDFARAAALVVYLGTPREGSQHADDWGLAHLAAALERGIPCLVYVAPNYPRELLKGLSSLATEAKSVNTREEFVDLLRQDLQSLILRNEC
jgi:hypothetical protein